MHHEIKLGIFAQLFQTAWEIVFLLVWLFFGEFIDALSSSFKILSYGELNLKFW